jgi:CBS domain-containing protein
MLHTVEEHPHEQQGPSQPDVAAPPGLAWSQNRNWAHHVRDVMTTAVVTVDQLTPYKEIARLLAENQVSGCPVLSAGRHVVGVVTEGNLLAEEGKRAWERMAVPGHGLRRQQHWSLTAGELMSSPAITIGPDATIAGAARAMNDHHVRRLPVVDSSGFLLGIVSRRDLLSVFLRPDADVAAEVREIFGEVLNADPRIVGITVQDGVLALTWPPGADHDLAAVAIQLAWGVDGVIDIIDRRATSNGGTERAAHRASATSEST